MKRVLLGLLVSFGVSLGVGYFVAKYYLDPKLLEIVRSRGSEFLKVPLQVQSLKTQLLPFQIELRGVRFEKAEFDESIASLKVDFVDVSADLKSLLQGEVGVVVGIRDSAILLITKNKPEKTQTQESPLPDLSPQIQALEQIRSQRKLNLRLQIQNATVDVRTDDVRAKTAKNSAETNAKANPPKLPLQLTIEEALLSTNMNSGEVSIKTQIFSPISQSLSASTNYKLNGEWLEFSEGKLNIMGLGLLFSGQSHLVDHRQEFSATANIPDLSKVRIPENTSCAKPQAGSLQVTAKLTTLAQLKQPNAVGSLNASKVSVYLDCKSEGQLVRGDFLISAKTDFQYALEKLKAPILNISVDGKALSIFVPGKFKKSPNDELNFFLEGSATQDRLNMSQFGFQFDRIKGTGKGTVAVGQGSSKFSVKVEPVRLNGLEKYFPALQGELSGQSSDQAESQQLSGELEVDASIEGPLESPEKLTVSLNPVKLTGFRTTVKYTSDDKLTVVDGPVQANLFANIQAVGTNLSKASLDVFANLTDMDIQNPQFSKKSKELLKLEVKGAAKGQDLALTGSKVTLPSGVLTIEGSVKQPQSPILDLKLSTTNFDIDKILAMMPAFKGYKVPGLVNGILRVQGRYDLKGGVKTSPLLVSGNFVSSLGQVIVPVVATPQNKSGKDAKPEEALPPPREAMFESTPLYKNLTMTIQTKIRSFQYGDLIANDLAIRNVINDGVMGTSGQIGRIFDGSVVLKSFRYPLLERAPTISTSGTFKDINLDKSITWFSKDYKETVRGQASGDFDFVLPDRSRADFLDKVAASGSATVKNGFLSTLKFDELANEKLSKLPGVGKNNKVSTKGATADLVAKYIVKDGRLNLDPLNAITPERNEMRSKGWITLKDKTCDLEATLFLTNSPVGGTILEANNDGQGRLKVPVRIRGSVFSPDMSIATEVVQTLLSNAAKLEAEKLTKRLTGQGEAKAKDLGDQLKKEAEKKLKELFK